jgi:excisionase family DNA binding protein
VILGTAPRRDVENFVHGLDGPIGVIGGPEAIALLWFRDMDSYQRQHRGANVDLDRATAVLRLVSAAYRAAPSSPNGTFPAEPAEHVPQSNRQLTTAQASTVIGITPRAIRKAITNGRLHAERSGGRWLINATDAALYRQTG